MTTFSGLNELKDNPTESDLEDWVKSLMLNYNLNFHPDDKPELYVDDNSVRIFNDSEVEIINSSLDNSFEEFGDRVYTVSLKVQRELMELGMKLKHSSYSVKKIFKDKKSSN